MPVDATSLVLPAGATEDALPGADDVDWLIDNAVAYSALVAAIRDAATTIWISQLALDADCTAYDADGSSVRIVDELLDAAARGVEVRVLLNASLLLDTAAPLRRYVAASATRQRVRVRGVSRFPQLLHAKMVITDGETAFLVGSPFANGYWDDASHVPVDSRRPSRELGGRPVHDVSTRLTGAPAGALCATFVELWNDADDVAPGDEEELVACGDGGEDASCVSVVRTEPGAHGAMEILPALLDGIARARELIYVEHQYLSSRLVVNALAGALERHRELEIVAVLNQNPDVTAYRGWQNDRLRAAKLLDHPRVGLFALWTSAVDHASGRRQLNQVFVHSKVVVIDDRWALAGSANLDGVSLHSYGDDFSGVLGRRIFRGVRNFDVNVVVQDDSGSHARHLRTALWSEHLGAALEANVERPADGWLPLWRAVTRHNASALCRSPGERLRDGPFLLPYSTASTPRAQLADVGVLFAPDSIELCFEPSWLEVHFSPNWVRNMFA